MIVEIDRVSCKVWPNLRLTNQADPHTKLPLYELQESVSITVRVEGVLYRFVIPKGYLTDLASVPKALHSVFNPNDEDTVLAALIHDWLYSTNGFTHPAPFFEKFVSLQGDAPLTALSKHACDEILYQVMRANGATWVRSQLYFFAVDNFGDSAWNGPH